MQHDTTSATTLAALREPAREDAASTRGRLGRFWYRTMARIARYCARHELLAPGGHLLRDVGLTRDDAPRSPRSIEAQHASRLCGGAWGWP